MKTALQILREKLTSKRERYSENLSPLDAFDEFAVVISGQICTIDIVIDEIEQLLPTEREQIETAVIYGNRQEVYDGTETIGEHYFNNTYNE